jgi:alpha-maltose-1-phosphate synthase
VIRSRLLLICDFHLKYATQLARGLADVGADVALVTRDHDFEFGGEPGAMRRYVAARLDGRARHFVVAGRVRDPRSLPDLARLAQFVSGWSPHVIQVQDGPDLRPLLAAGAPARPYAVTIHDPSPHPGDEVLGPLARRTRSLLWRRAALIFVHGEALRDELERTAAPRAPVEIVPHGTGAPDVRPLPARPNLLFFGRLSHYKGLDTLLDAMPHVWASEPDVGLTIAGEGDLVAHPVLEDRRVDLQHAHIAEASVPELFAGTTCVVLPYRQGSQSGVGTLAQRFGRTIVATSVGSLPDLVRDGSGLIVPPENPRALADALVRVVQDPSGARIMGEQAARRIDAATGWTQVAELTLGVYRRHGFLP